MNNTLRSRAIDLNLSKTWNSLVNQRGKTFGFMIIGALLAFELFNFSTTEFALQDVLGDLSFMGIRWATILSIAFCGIDFAGIARIFTPEQGAEEPAEVWYLFGAWILAAAMNATLTWWGVSVAIVGHTSQGAAVLGNETIRNVVPVFVAIMVWVIRLLIIGTISVAGERLFSMDNRSRRPQASQQNNYQPRQQQPSYQQGYRNNNSQQRPVLTTASQLRSAQRPMPRQQQENGYNSRSEPSYHNLMSSPKNDQYE